MPSEQAAQDASGVPDNQTVERVLALLAEALETADALKLPPEIGAKLRELHDWLAQLHALGRPRRATPPA